MQLQESGEMYLETILVLTQRGTPFRSIDVCEEMGYSKPSVSRAMGLLKQGELITVDAGGYIALTAAGREIAEKIYDRHKLLTAFFTRLGVDQETAAADACRMEHVISDRSFDALRDFMRAHPEV
ncbi:MAG: metal-dependent transcriptional regulator [Oscillospiraceae bacterium]|nr:metal-dependent transcriptional regulator [Oscillospiraceae bacterium]